MKKYSEKEDAIEKLKHNILNKAFWAAIPFVILTQTIEILNTHQIWKDPYFMLQTGVWLSFYLVFFLRNKLGLAYKVTAFTLMVSTIYISALIHKGFLASSKIYIVGISVFLSLILSHRKTIFWVLFFTTIHGLFGYLYVKGILKPQINAQSYVLSAQSWITDGILLCMTSIALVYSGKIYLNSISQHISQAGSTEKKLKKQESRLLESDFKYKQLVEAFPDIVMIHKPNGEIVYGNERLTELTGLQPNNYNAKDKQAQIHPEDKPRVLYEMQKLLKENCHITPIIENRFITHTGETVWLSGRITKLYLDGELHFQTVTRDITEQKKAQKILQDHQRDLETKVKERTEELQSTLDNLTKAQTRLIQAEKMASIGTLTAGIAHEINNPMNFIAGGLNGLEDYFKKNNIPIDTELNLLQRSMREGIERTVNVVKALNELSRSETDLTEACSLHQILNNCLDMLHNFHQDKIHIHRSYDPKIHTIPGNISKMHQIFMNLILNAIQAIESKGNIYLTTLKEASKIQVQIKDDGCGIPAHLLPRITDPFFTTKDPGKGTGLGLSLTLNALEEMQAKITFHSEVGKGTTALLEFPL